MENLDKYEKGVGPIYGCQLALQTFLEDEDATIELSKREYAVSIYKWLGSTEYSVDELFEKDFKKALFILEIQDKYYISPNRYNSNLIMNCIDAFSSLKYQYEMILKNEFKTVASLKNLKPKKKIFAKKVAPLKYYVVCNIKYHPSFPREWAKNSCDYYIKTCDDEDDSECYAGCYSWSGPEHCEMCKEEGFKNGLFVHFCKYCVGLGFGIRECVKK